MCTLEESGSARTRPVVEMQSMTLAEHLARNERYSHETTEWVVVQVRNVAKDGPWMDYSRTSAREAFVHLPRLRDERPDLQYRAKDWMSNALVVFPDAPIDWTTGQTKVDKEY